MPRTLAVDASAAAEANGSLIPEGDYWDVEIEDVAVKVSQSQANPGKEMYNLRLKIRDEVDGAKGRKLWDTVCLFPEENPISLLQLMTSTGWSTELNAEGLLEYPTPEELKGAICAIKIVHGKDGRKGHENDDPRHEVKRYLKPKGTAGPRTATAPKSQKLSLRK